MDYLSLHPLERNADESASNVAGGHVDDQRVVQPVVLHVVVKIAVGACFPKVVLFNAVFINVKPADDVLNAAVPVVLA